MGLGAREDQAILVSLPKLSPAEVEAVLRRAAELDSARRDEPGTPADATDPAELVRLAEEAGLSRTALDHALVELRRGALVAASEGGTVGPPHGEPAWVQGALGPARLIVAREVPGSRGAVERALERFMSEQLMVVRRHHGDRIEWEKAKGLFPGLARSLDFSERYSFGPVSRVETVLEDVGDDTCAVTFRIDLAEERNNRLWGIGARGGAMVSIGWAFAHFSAYSGPGWLTLGMGGAAAAYLWAAERRRYRELAEQIELGPERFLDLLVKKRRKALPGKPGVKSTGHGETEDKPE
jgi:hypothetical protein